MDACDSLVAVLVFDGVDKPLAVLAGGPTVVGDARRAAVDPFDRPERATEHSAFDDLAGPSRRGASDHLSPGVDEREWSCSSELLNDLLFHVSVEMGALPGGSPTRPWRWEAWGTAPMDLHVHPSVGRRGVPISHDQLRQAGARQQRRTGPVREAASIAAGRLPGVASDASPAESTFKVQAVAASSRNASTPCFITDCCGIASDTTPTRTQKFPPVRPPRSLLTEALAHPPAWAIQCPGSGRDFVTASCELDHEPGHTRPRPRAEDQGPRPKRPGVPYPAMPYGG